MSRQKLIKTSPNVPMTGRYEGDCVIRAITESLKGFLSYQEVYEEIEKYRGNYEAKDFYAYRPVFEKVLKDMGYVIINTERYNYSWFRHLKMDIKTPLSAQSFCKFFDVSVMVANSNHIVYVDKNGIYDTWDSSIVRAKSIYIHESDLKLIGIKNPTDEDNEAYYFNKTISDIKSLIPNFSIIKKGKRWIIENDERKKENE